jgi:hypothetical protein
MSIKLEPNDVLVRGLETSVRQCTNSNRDTYHAHDATRLQYRAEVLRRMKGKRVKALREKVAEVVKNEPTFNWENKDGEARQRHVDNHYRWADRVLPQILALSEEA